MTPINLSALQRTLAMDRGACRSAGEDWGRRLREEALRTMVHEFGVSAGRARLDLTEALAERPGDEIALLEEIVLSQRIVVASGEASSFRAELQEAGR